MFFKSSSYKCLLLNFVNGIDMSIKCIVVSISIYMQSNQFKLLLLLKKYFCQRTEEKMKGEQYVDIQHTHNIYIITIYDI